MNKILRLLFGVVSAAIIIVLLGLSGCSSAQNIPNPALNANTVASPGIAPAAGSAPGGAPQEGIKVHGHWTIDVTNPDGSLAQHREFENALNAGGPYLAKILSRNGSVGGWGIGLYGSAFDYSDMGSGEALIVESSNPYSSYTNYVLSKNLTVTLPSSGPNANKVVLSGTATAVHDGIFNSVNTYTTILPSSSPPSGSYPSVDLTAFTSANQIVSMTAGQQVTVTVVISFS